MNALETCQLCPFNAGQHFMCVFATDSYSVTNFTQSYDVMCSMYCVFCFTFYSFSPSLFRSIHEYRAHQTARFLKISCFSLQWNEKKTRAKVHVYMCVINTYCLFKYCTGSDVRAVLNTKIHNKIFQIIVSTGYRNYDSIQSAIN